MKDKRTVLVVDDEAAMRKNINDLLGREGYRVAEAGDGAEGLRAFRELTPALVLLDINLPKMDGISVLGEMKRLNADVPVIVFTAYGTSERAIMAMKAGAYDYLDKPFDLDEFLLTVKRAVGYGDLLREVRQLRSRVSQDPPLAVTDSIIGAGPRMQEVFKQIGRAAPTDTTVLIQGESGTGKELIAQAIQRHSLRKDRPFIIVNCGGLTETLLESELFGHEKGAFTGAVARREGRFEVANGGTVFLDEINNMPMSLQMKLLRVLQQRTYERVGGNETLTTDVRIIAATNSDIEQDVRSGRIREDLFYRLNVIHIRVPALRERAEDIPPLITHFCKKYSPDGKIVVSPEVVAKLSAYHWPGNVRELENIIQRMIVMAQGNVITTDYLPITVSAAPPLASAAAPADERSFRDQVRDFERSVIAVALRRTAGNQSRAAELLRMSRRLLFEKIKLYNIRSDQK
ncbi:MAG: sigma-54-dependent Fis family transcriptional regulator [Bacteroidetes bacterium]|nr:MAG: sigma-54-dependent Fis family transcriptional regulator [Bacteroidota bacterium]